MTAPTPPTPEAAQSLQPIDTAATPAVVATPAPVAGPVADAAAAATAADGSAEGAAAAFDPAVLLTPDYLLVYFALILGLGLLYLLSLVMKRMMPNFSRLRLGVRLRVSEVRSVDYRRRLVLVKRDDVEHLLLLSDDSALVIETGIQTKPRRMRAEPDPDAEPAPDLGPSRDPEPAAMRSSAPVEETGRRSRRAIAPEQTIVDRGADTRREPTLAPLPDPDDGHGGPSLSISKPDDYR